MRVTGIALVSAVGGALLVPAVPHAADSALEAKLESRTQSIAAGTPVRLDSSHSTGAIVGHLWDLDGDGSFETDTGTDAVAGAMPLDAGPLTVRVQVVDDQGNRDEANLELTITPAATTGSAPAAPDKSISKSAIGPDREVAAPEPQPAPGNEQQATSSAAPAPAEHSPAAAPPATAPRHPAPVQGAGPSGGQLGGVPQMISTAGSTSAATAKRSSTPTARAAAAAAASSGVTIKNFLFNPSSVSVHVGDTVKWTNQDTELHSATANDGSFDTGRLKKGRSGSHKFTKAGSIAYICSVHPNMKGTVVVAAGGSGSGGSGSGSGSGSDSTSTTKTTRKSSSLPLTGLEIAAVLALAALLTGSGTLLRRAVEQRP
jgi:plastocyanin